MQPLFNKSIKLVVKVNLVGRRKVRKADVLSFILVPLHNRHNILLSLGKLPLPNLSKSNSIIQRSVFLELPNIERPVYVLASPYPSPAEPASPQHPSQRPSYEAVDLPQVARGTNIHPTWVQLRHKTHLQIRYRR